MLQLVLMQLGLTLLLALGLLLAGQNHAVAALAGGVAATVANGVAALLVFRRYKASEGAALTGRFYAAEMARLVITAVFFLLVVLWLRPLSVGAMLGAYLLVHLSTGALMSIASHRAKR
ncbi:MAG: ATP synthase subunit I [Pseudomonadota bacterium]